MGQYVVKVDGVDLAAAKKEYADKFKDVTALEAELEAAQNEKWQVERGAYETKQAAISNNLSKIELVPNPELLDAPEAMTEANDLNKPDVFDQRFRIYTFDDKSFFDRLKNDVFVTKGESADPVPVPLPVGSCSSSNEKPRLDICTIVSSPFNISSFISDNFR